MIINTSIDDVSIDRVLWSTQQLQPPQTLNVFSPGPQAQSSVANNTFYSLFQSAGNCSFGLKALLYEVVREACFDFIFW